MSEDLAEEKCFQMENRCSKCKETGVIRVCTVPDAYFEHIMITAFECPQCGYTEKYIDDLRAPTTQGIHIEFKVEKVEDLSRSLIRLESCLIAIPELEFESVPFKNRGSFLTIETFLDRSIWELSELAEFNKDSEELAKKLLDFVEKLKDLKSGNKKFTIILDDPSGNSFIENPFHPSNDPQMWILHYKRTKSENKLLKLKDEETVLEPIFTKDPVSADINNNEVETEESLPILHVPCASCGKEILMRNQILNIPNFKDVLLSAAVCDSCGYRTTEVRCVATFSELAVRYVVNVKTKDDLKRDFIKSDYCCVSIPELGLDLSQGVFKGTYTTIEGFMKMVRDDIGNVGQTEISQVMQSVSMNKISKFISDFDAMIAGDMPFTLIADDATGNSFIEDLMAPDPDPNLHCEHYKRTKEQNEILCLEE